VTPDLCRRARLERGWTPWKLAQATGLAERTIMDFEAGVTSPRPGTLIALRRVLGADAGSVLS
jgi:transcriptional regulator with XRE-family HTH domain